MRLLKLTAVVVWLFALGSLAVSFNAVSLSAVSNGSFTATWTPATDPAEQYEFRWKHFASSGWIVLPTVPGDSGSMQVSFAPLPNTPMTDRWMCVDARMVKPALGAWLSETPDGAACNTVDVSVILVPPPPVVVPPAPVTPAPIPTPPAPVPPPLPPQPDIFTNLKQEDGRLSIEYQMGACPRGVQQTTSAVKNGTRTITLTCRR